MLERYAIRLTKKFILLIGKIERIFSKLTRKTWKIWYFENKEELIKVNIDEKNQYVKNFWILLVTNYQIGLRTVIEVLVSKLS